MLYGDSELNMTGFDPSRFGVFADEDYMKAKGFQDYRMTYCTPLPGEELPAARKCRTSPLHATLEAAGCVHTQTFGWERPKWFSPYGLEEDCDYRHNNIFEIIRDECLAVREQVGLLDLSGFAKYEVSGPDAERFLNRICANRMSRESGGIVLAPLTGDSLVNDDFPWLSGGEIMVELLGESYAATALENPAYDTSNQMLRA
jgi:dimethylglycine dehydrogenase